MIIISINRW